MAKSKVTPIAAARQAEPRTIPLAEITITLPASRDFSGDPEGKTVTIGGAHLAMMLAWLERTRNLSRESESTVDEVRMDLMGLGDTLLGLSTADLSGNAIDDPPVFRLLYKITCDLAARLGAIEDKADILKLATVTIGAPAAEAK